MHGSHITLNDEKEFKDVVKAGLSIVLVLHTRHSTRQTSGLGSHSQSADTGWWVVAA